MPRLRRFFHGHELLLEASSLRRNFGLDIVRAAAILLVVFCHSLYFVPTFQSQLYLSYWAGFLGVEIFFVLSGYLIGSILLGLVLDGPEEESFGGKLGGFWIRRWFRTLPNYYLFLMINFTFLFLESGEIGRYWDYLVFGQNLLGSMDLFMAESWSLVIEEWFYLTFPLVLWLFMKLFGQSTKSFVLAVSLYLLTFVCLRTAGASAEILEQWDAEIRKIAIVRLDSIAYGALVMVCMKALPDFMFRMRFIFSGVGLLGLTWSSIILHQELTLGVSPFLAANHFTLTSISLALFLPVAVYQTQSSERSRVRTCIASISILSYSMYLLHLMIAARLILPHLGNWPWPVQFLFYWFSTILLSYIVYTLYERPMTSLREKFSRSRRSDPI